MTHRQQSHPKYRPDIDGLRSIAVLSVVFFHAFPEIIPGGFIGVDVFFVISGYLISSIIYSNVLRGDFSFSDFFIRRINRIFPSLAIVMISCLLVGWYILLSDEYKQLGKHVVGGAGFISNILLWNEAGYFDSSADSKPLLHLWSLGIEEQFYLFWPVAIWFSYRNKISLSGVCATFLILSLCSSLWQIRVSPVADFYGPHARFWELMAGSLLAYALVRESNQPLWKSKLSYWLTSLGGKRAVLKGFASIAGASLLTSGLFFINKGLGFPGAWAIIPVLSAVLIIASGPDVFFNKKLLSNKAMVWVGLISFPLYLWHWPLLAFSRIVIGQHASPSVRVLIIILSFILAWLTVMLVERPIRHGGRRKTKAITLLFLMSATGYSGYSIYSHDGIKSRTLIGGDPVNSSAFEWGIDKRQDSQCISRLNSVTTEFCLYPKEFPVKAALIGDSHANSIYDFLSKYYREKKYGVIQLGKSGCLPLLDVERDMNDCPNIMNDIVEYLEESKDISQVFITGRFSAAFTGKNVAGTERKGWYTIRYIKDPSITDRAVIFEVGLRSILERLSKANKKVTVILDYPELNFDPRSCIKRLFEGNDCRIEKSAVLNRQAGYRKLIETLSAAYGAKIIDPLGAFCPDEYCYAQIDGKVLYRDDHHLGVYGSDFLWEKRFTLD